MSPWAKAVAGLWFQSNGLLRRGDTAINKGDETRDKSTRVHSNNYLEVGSGGNIQTRRDRGQGTARGCTRDPKDRDRGPGRRAHSPPHAAPGAWPSPSASFAPGPFGLLQELTRHTRPRHASLCIVIDSFSPDVRCACVRLASVSAFHVPRTGPTFAFDFLLRNFRTDLVF